MTALFNHTISDLARSAPTARLRSTPRGIGKVLLVAEQAKAPRHANVPAGVAFPVAAGDGHAAPSDAYRDSMRILVVDDDVALRKMVIDFLDEHDVQTLAASGRQETARHLAENAPDLILLDLRLGQEDGLDVLREIRAKCDLPVIITTGHRCDEIDRVVGLELGADDYIAKPFGLRELLARIRAVLRRRNAIPLDPKPERERGRSKFIGWELDRRGRRLTDPSGVVVTLTKGEYNLLLAFLDAPQRPLQREHLLRATRVHEDIFDRSIDVQVLRLRRKLEPDANAPRLIETLRGVGYVFTQPVETA